MKGSILLLLLLTTWSISFSQDQKGIARVNRIDGVDVYFMSEPLNNYEVVFDVSSGIKGLWQPCGILEDGKEVLICLLQPGDQTAVITDMILRQFNSGSLANSFLF